MDNLLKEVLDHKEQYSLHDLFRIRDSLYVLDQYNLADLDLLKEVELFIQQRRGRLND